MKHDRIKLLLVEDDVIDQMAFKRAVKKQALDYDFHVSNCVKDAIEILSKEEFDIVITDYNLGDGTGFEIFPLIKDTPIIFTTGAGDEEIAVQALKSGAYDYLIKDRERIYLQALPDKIENATSQKKFERERKKAQEDLRKSEEQFRVLFENSPDAIFVKDELGFVLDVNLAACQLHQLSKEELRGMQISDLVPVCLRESIKLDYKDWLDGNLAYRESVFLRKDDVKIPVEIRANRIQYSEQNALLLLVRDISERKQAEEKIALTNRELKRERDKLQYRLSFEDLINNISTRFINLTAKELHEEMNSALARIGEFSQTDRSYVFLLNDEHTKISNVFEWRRTGIPSLQSNFQDVLTKSIPWWMTELYKQECIVFVNPKDIPQAAKEEKLIQEKSDLKSIIVLPMIYEKNLIGFLGFDSVAQEKKWDWESVKLLQIVSEIIVNALQRKKSEETLNYLYQSLKSEVEIAANVQRYLLPEWLIYEKELMFSSTYTPSLKIGGDLFDVIPVSETKYVVYVADISGHGVQAALMMTAVKSFINMIVDNSKEDLRPHSLLNRLNNILCKELFQENYMTILLCIIDLERNEIRYFNAGHPPLIQFDTVSKQTYILQEKGSLPIGWSSKISYLESEEDVISMDENKIILLYTDGIFECENKQGEQLGISGFRSLIENQPFSNCLILPHKFKQSLVDLRYDISPDDFTLLSFRKQPLEDVNRMQRMFRIRSHLENSGPIGKECEMFIHSHLKNQELAAKIELIVNEFLNNIIEHGLKNKKDTIVIMEILIDEFIRITFWDKGLDWNLPEPEITSQNQASVDKFRGLGLQIVYTLAEQVSLNRYDEINESVILVKK
jgi:PAS domain S-box-containing protein